MRPQCICMEPTLDLSCPIRLISTAISGGILDDRCKQESCAIWDHIQNRCGLIR